MTRMKKLASILLALVMVMAVATASAATVTNSTGRTYNAYQIFAGTQVADSSNEMLGDIVWGSGVNTETLIPAFVGTDFAGCTTAAEVAAKLTDDEGDDQAQAEAFADLLANHLTATCTSIAADATEVTLDDGYYLLVDTSSETDEEGDDVPNYARNAALLQVTKSIAITAKYDVPEVEKKVNDTDYVDTNIGDTVTFTLTATMPERLDGYDTYKIVFHDKLSDGLAYAGNLKVTIKGTEIQATTGEGDNLKTNYTVDHNNGMLTITFDDVLSLGAGVKDKIVVTYDAIVDDDAVIGGNGNPNTVKLEYSNDPNWDGTGDKEPTGNTPPDEVLVFTYELDVTKVDGENYETKLSSAEFVLYRGEGEAIEYVIVDEDGKVTDWTSDKDKASKLISDENGFFKVIGLDTGIYHLEETKAPAGYNLLKDPIEIEITATIATDDTTGKTAVDTLKIKVDGSEKDGTPATGVVEATVINNSGATLPETGGMGTTILYVAGGLLIAAALVVLLAKRRTAA